MSNPNPIFIPGPTNIPERLRRAMDVASRDHRAPDFVDLIRPVFENLKPVFGTSAGQVVLFPATGTGGWEAAITNTLSPGDTVLAARHGMFSQRWIDLCRRHGLDMRVFEAPWGEGVPVEAFAKALAADTDHRIKAVLATHNETATGVRSDIAAVRQALTVADHPALLCVDGVSSIGSLDFRMDEWGVDLAVAGSQKGFMLPAGLAIVGVSPKARAAMETATCPRAFFDMRDMMAANAAGSFPYTPSVPLLCGLRESLAMLAEEGREAVHARHHRIAEGVRRAVAAWGLSLCARRPALYSDTVTAILVPDGYDAGALVAHAYTRYGVPFGIGLGDVAGTVFRIGHLGQMTDVMALSGLATAEMAMVDLGYPITLGSGVAAAQAYYRETAAHAVPAAAAA
ncbi:aminotransferase class V-fold PLP-dependent enzyme [Roseospira marina]|uniref:Aminotransferase class V-fold PLP-dependent enzyme n=1 Tax=Roseospira marina TaxID=140057 RepID=A0A5M6IF74_9PROT|nr:L-aspartate--glyoxylate aminotransferase BhcA [Roseospira marina]KAA5606934.1 aminotransferase class V-fold PLP-dependent enzyme [Roseospira marina]MBB4312892.1 alanine-glyoxylate transaminase/serine-glyoxylate transaminase/serine-pyruvate transaminase [Roseospira marina]MBB5086335.1 alanine-glyoxylate transaminase/serine-glyoxylate transaminase/serine-pyruvate transaminase [Roseospira marina]